MKSVVQSMVVIHILSLDIFPGKVFEADGMREHFTSTRENTLKSIQMYLKCLCTAS
jgi:hypothetical protein